MKYRLYATLLIKLEPRHRYLAISKKLLAKEVMTDRRWNNLEGSLSETFGINLNWRKLRGSSNWIVKPKMLEAFDPTQYNFYDNY